MLKVAILIYYLIGTLLMIMAVKINAQEFNLMKAGFNFPKYHLFLPLIILYFLACIIVTHENFWGIFHNTTDAWGLVYKQMWQNLVKFHLALNTRHSGPESMA